MIETALIIAFVVLFLHATTWEGMVFQIVAEKLHTLPEWMKKPLYDCPICMAPWWGSVILLLMCLHSGDWLDPLSWLLLVFAAGGINTVLIHIIEKARHGQE